MQKSVGPMDFFNVDNLRDDHLTTLGHRTTYNLIQTQSQAVNINYLTGGYKSRLHYHELKFNRLFVVAGTIEVTIYTGENDKIVRRLGINEESRKIDITPNSPHEIFALQDSIVVEVDFTRCLTKDMHSIKSYELADFWFRG